MSHALHAAIRDVNRLRFRHEEHVRSKELAIHEEQVHVPQHLADSLNLDIFLECRNRRAAMRW
jgi:hypothetical protein